MKRKSSGLIIAAPASGSGKTIITLGLIAALKKNGLKIKAIPIYGNWMEIDKPEDLDLAEELIEQKKLNLTSPIDNL